MTKKDLRQFDYEKVARLDTKMWRAYYNHQFFRLFWQLICLVKSQLGLNWFVTVRLAYYSGWAAADYRINRKKLKRERVLSNLIKFYKLVCEHVLEPFNYEKTAELELEWWDVHRRSYENNPELEQSLADAAAAMYNLESDKLKDYAKYRAEAMILPRHVGDKVQATDWDAVGDLVLKAWKSLHEAVLED